MRRLGCRRVDMRQDCRDPRVVAPIPVAVCELLKHRCDGGGFHRLLRRAHDHQQDLDESFDQNLIAILPELRSDLLRLVFRQSKNSRVLFEASAKGRGVVVEVLLCNAHVGVDGERVLLTCFRRRRILDFVG